MKKDIRGFLVYPLSLFLMGSILTATEPMPILPDTASQQLINNMETANTPLFFAGSSKKRQVREAESQAKIGVVELIGGKPTHVEVLSNFRSTFSGNNHLVQGKKVSIRLRDSGAQLTGDLSFIPAPVFRQIPGAKNANPTNAFLEVMIDKRSHQVNYQLK